MIWSSQFLVNLLMSFFNTTSKIVGGKGLGELKTKCCEGHKIKP